MCIRDRTYADCAWPAALSALCRNNGLTLSLALAGSMALFLVLVLLTKGSLWHVALIGEGGNFYRVFPHNLMAVSYTHLRAHETPEHLVCRLLPEQKKFHSPLRHSRITVSYAVPHLSPGISHQNYHSSSARFTPYHSKPSLLPPFSRCC